MKRTAIFLILTVSTALLLRQSASAAARIWNDSSPDFNAATSWTGGSPAGNNVARFDAPFGINQPTLTADIATAGILFNGPAVSGFNIGGPFTLTLTGDSTTGTTGVANASAAAIRGSNTSGTNTISANVLLGAAGGVSSFVQVAGGTLVVNGAISAASTASLSLRNSSTAGGIIQLNGANAHTTGSAIDSSGLTVVLGNNSALGTGTFSINNSATIQAGGGTRTLTNSIVFAADTTVSGGNAFVINGNVSTAGANSRTVTISNTGGTTFGGNVTIQGNTAPGTLVINGSTAAIINGVVQDGAAGPGLLRYSGSSTLTLNSANSYSGGTQVTIAGGTIIANADGALGTGNVSLTSTGVTLTLQNGALNNYIADNAAISLVTGATLNLNFAGASDVVGSFLINGMVQGAGVHNAMTDPAFITGLGSITVIPEPATYMLFGLGLLACAQRFRRAKKS